MGLQLYEQYLAGQINEDALLNESTERGYFAKDLVTGRNTAEYLKGMKRVSSDPEKYTNVVSLTKQVQAAQKKLEGVSSQQEKDILSRQIIQQEQKRINLVKKVGSLKGATSTAPEGEGNNVLDVIKKHKYKAAAFVVLALTAGIAPQIIAKAMHDKAMKKLIAKKVKERVHLNQLRGMRKDHGRWIEKLRANEAAMLREYDLLFTNLAKEGHQKKASIKKLGDTISKLKSEIDT